MLFKHRVLLAVRRAAFRIQRRRIRRAHGWRKTYLTHLCISNPDYKKRPPRSLYADSFCRRFSDARAAGLFLPFPRACYLMDYLLAHLTIGAGDDNYFYFLFFRRGWFYRNTCITSRRQSFISRHVNNPAMLPMLNDKALFAEHWSKFFARPFCRLPDASVTRESFAARFSECGKLVVKPIAGLAGNGLRILDAYDRLSDIYDELCAAGEAVIVEAYIEQTGALHDINPSSMNTLRVLTLRDGDQIRVLSAILRAGGEGALIDNLHAGGIGYSVHPETGRVYRGISMTGRTTAVHPSSGIRVTDTIVPRWAEVCRFCTDVHLHAPHGLEYIGWDVCVCEDALYMIEGNGNPGAAPALSGQNLWKTMRCYLDAHENELYDLR